MVTLVNNSTSARSERLPNSTLDTLRSNDTTEEGSLTISGTIGAMSSIVATKEIEIVYI